MIRVKICGLTNLDDALYAAECGASALGFVLAKSKRQVSPAAVAAIRKRLPPFITVVGVFVNAPLKEMLDSVSMCQLNAVQLHGDENRDYCEEVFSRVAVIKAHRVRNVESLETLEKYKGCVSAHLLDTYTTGQYGGTGQSFNWKITESLEDGLEPLILAGGLNKENIVAALKTVKPYGVDVSSGVELYPGKKDYKKVKEFMNEVTGFRINRENMEETE